MKNPENPLSVPASQFDPLEEAGKTYWPAGTGVFYKGKLLGLLTKIYVVGWHSTLYYAKESNTYFFYDYQLSRGDYTLKLSNNFLLSKKLGL